MLSSEKALIIKLLVTLQAASNHLEYCGYGDKWERECATAEKLEEKITAALEEAEQWTKLNP